MKRLFLIFFPVLLLGKGSFSQNIILKEDTFDYYEMSLEQLLSLKAHGVPSELEELINSLILAASKRPLTARESPGIVTLITDEEIRNSGARDLIDVLRLVPGMDFGVDVEGAVGLGTRGLWAHEGKILLLIDGQEMNENLFGINALGNHYPVDQIKKIEVVRGPGSAIYGGFAEYGVINIITKSAADLPGVSLSALAGQMENAMGRRNFNLSAGKQSKDFQFSMGAFLGQGNRSDQDYTDFFGNTYNMAGNSNLDPTHLNVGAAYKGLSARWIMDLYQTTVRDGYDSATTKAYPINYTSNFTEIKYSAHVGKNKKLAITPGFSMKNQTPRETIWEHDSIVGDYSKSVQRYTGTISASYNFTRKINFIAGAEAYMDKARDNSNDSSFFSNGEKEVRYSNQAYFLQGLAKTPIVNFIAGARFDHHSDYGSAFVPRVGLTKKFKKFHFKALYSNAFRAPTIENINLEDSTGIKPELTRVIELEAGYQLTRKSLITANLFDIHTDDPIVYFVGDSGQADNYKNFGSGGSRGLEIEYRMRDKWGYVMANYSYYSVADKENSEDYLVYDDETMLLAFPSHKANLSASVKFGKHFVVTPTLSYIGKRYGYTEIDSLGEYIQEEFRPVTLANLFIIVNNFGVKGLSIGLGCYDILNGKYLYIQLYYGDHAALPGPSREFLFKLTYEIKKEKKNK